MAIKPENIMSISAKEYFDINSLNPEDYNIIGVNLEKNIPYSNGHRFLDDFSEIVPGDAKVVVGFRQIIMPNFSENSKSTSFHYFANGTAIIPKEKP